MFLKFISGADALSFCSAIPQAEVTTSKLCLYKKGKSAAMRIQSNKEVQSLMKSERASAPEITKNANITIEAAFGIPLFLFAVLCLIWLIEIQSIRISMINAAHNAAKSAAEDTSVIPVLNTWKLKSDILSLIGEDRIARSILKGGKDGISCSGSYVSPDTGEINIKVTYRVQTPVPVFGNPSAKLEETFRISAWTGYMSGREGSHDADIVYVTDTGAVYHEDYQCTYLHLSIRSVLYNELPKLRNESGGKYHACEKCAFGSAMGGVYITQTGDKYHNSLNCSGLKRTIHAVKRSQVTGMGGCSRCSQ